jgi:hypothetical protein
MMSDLDDMWYTGDRKQHTRLRRWRFGW